MLFVRNFLKFQKPFQRGRLFILAGTRTVLGVSFMIAVLAAGVFGVGEITDGLLIGKAGVATSSGSSDGQAVKPGARSSTPTPSPTHSPAPIHTPVPTPSPT